MKCFPNLLHALLAWLLHTIDKSVKQTFVDANVVGYCRNIQLREFPEESPDLIVWVWFCCLVETTDVQVLIKRVPVDVITKPTDMQVVSFFLARIFQSRESLERPTERLPLVRIDIDTSIFEPNSFYFLHYN